MPGPRPLLLALSAAVAAVGTLTAVTAGPAPASSPSPRTVLAADEVPATPRPCVAQPAAASAPPPQGVGVGVVVTVGALTAVRVEDGVPVRARTTTGQAPCATDLFVDESGAPLPAHVRTAVLAAVAEHGLDDEGWRPGRWRSLR